MSEPKKKIINGLTFLVAQPYAEGHVCTAAEAKALNQTRSENIGNNVRQRIKDMLAENKPEAEIVAMVAEVDNAYEFNMSSVSSARQLDPVEREARKIARELLKAHLAQTGRKLTVAPEGETDESWKEKIEDQLDDLQTNPEILKVANENVKAKAKQADKLAGILGGTE